MIKFCDSSAFEIKTDSRGCNADSLHISSFLVPLTYYNDNGTVFTASIDPQFKDLWLEYKTSWNHQRQYIVPNI